MHVARRHGEFLVINVVLLQARAHFVDIADAEGDMVVGIRLALGFRHTHGADVQKRMVAQIHPGARLAEWRPLAIAKTDHLRIKFARLFQIGGGDVVVVQSGNFHPARLAFVLWFVEIILPRDDTCNECAGIPQQGWHLRRARFNIAPS